MKNLVYFLLMAGVAIGCSSDDESPPPPPPNNFLVHINSNGPAFTFGGTDWEADRDNDASDNFIADPFIGIEGTDNDDLYQTEVFDMDVFSYNIAVPGEGPWEVKLHFAEIFHGVGANPGGIGSRVFDVDIENQPILTGYDITEQAGAAATAVVETVNGVMVNDGNLTITFTTVTDAAKVNGIEISGTF